MVVRILRLPEVIELTGLSRSTIYRLIEKGEFPTQLQLSTRTSGWRLDEIEIWIEELEKPEFGDE